MNGVRRTTGMVAAMLALVVGVAGPAPAEEATSVGITGTGAIGARVLVDGTLTLGDDALAPVTLAQDAQGDGTVPQAGIDFGTVTATTNLAARTVTYAITTYDMPSSGHAPFYGYSAPIMVDGIDATFFLSTGNTGAGFPPQTGPFWALCRIDGGYLCDQPLQGTMANNSITIRLPFALASISPGSTIETGSGVACEGLCSSPWAVLRFSDGTGGDRSPLQGFHVPGGVRLGIAKATTPVANVVTNVPATVAPDGSWTGELTRPGAAGSYVVVARSCWGTLEAPVCAEASTIIAA